MIVDIQVYNGEQEIFARKNMDYDTSLGWLLEKQEKGKEREFIKEVANNALEGKYKGIRYENKNRQSGLNIF